eukprot:2304229-Prymnesium_polylepis.2
MRACGRDGTGASGVSPDETNAGAPCKNICVHGRGQPVEIRQRGEQRGDSATTRGGRAYRIGARRRRQVQIRLYLSG